jgi:L-malate glycosyltransferase
MHIGLVTSMAGVGGTENVSARLIELLLRQQQAVTLISGPGPLVNRSVDLGAGWVRLDFYGSVWKYLSATFALSRALRELDLNVLHCQMARPVLACWAAAFLARKRVALVWHSRGLRAATYPWVCRLFSFLGVYAVGNCAHEQQKLIRHGFDSGRVAFCYNPLPAVSLRKTAHVSTELVLGSLSRLSRDRGVDEAIHILDELLKAGVSARLRIAGDGPELPGLRALCGQLNLNERVDFCGRISSLEDFFQTIDVLVNPLQASGDNGAGIGNNIIEAGMFQIPVVTYNSCGISEVILDGHTGYCIPIGDRSLFVSRLTRLASDPVLRSAMGKKLYAHVWSLCSPGRVYADLQNAYQSAIG